MKKTKFNAVLTVAVSLLFFTGLTAQRKQAFTENGVKNLITAVQSDNDGLKRSGIFLAGYYKVNEVGPVLLQSFSTENSKNKILIALSLYQIRDEQHLMKLMELAEKESNLEVKRICDAVIEQYQKDANFASR